MHDVRTGEMAARLQASSIRLLRLARREDSPGALSGPRLSALSLVARKGPMSLMALAEAEQVRPPTMTRLVDRLIADGLVTREADRADRRKVLISATAEGLAVAARSGPSAGAGLTARLQRLADSERRALARAVELLERVTRS